jgi:hypothetical protein
VTTMTEADVMTGTDGYGGPRCQSCGGPCWQWKGSVWGFTCSACLSAYLDAGERAWQACRLSGRTPFASVPRVSQDRAERRGHSGQGGHVNRR